MTDTSADDGPSDAGPADHGPADYGPAGDGSPDGGERSRHWVIDALIGGSLALTLITVAEAALPRLAHTPPARPRLAQAPPPAPAAPPALIAFQTPEPGYPVISPFGLRQLPWEGGGRLHAGIDIAAPAGLPVLAAADGVVTRIDSDGGYGRFVEVQHAAGLSTIYAHLGRFLPQLAPGAAVKAGAPIGLLGSTGSSTGAHLHFEVRDDQGRPLNPELFIGHSFAAVDDLPLSAAARFPRHVRVAYVSNIPKAKRDEMQKKELAAAAADAAHDASSATSDDTLPNASGTPLPQYAHSGATLPQFAHTGRPRGRFRLRE